MPSSAPPAAIPAPSFALSPERKSELVRRARDHARPSDRVGLMQLVPTLAVFLAAAGAALILVHVSIAAMVLAQLVAALAWVRLFILQHDLGHRCLFASRRANDIAGALLGVISLIPHPVWRRLHNNHHRHWAKLDHRGPGYLTTITVREYQGRSWLGRLGYRLYRNPLVVILLGGLFYFGLNYRVPTDIERHWRRERRSVYLTDLGILAWVLALGYWVGPLALLLALGPIYYVATLIVMWFFLVQHNYERTYWRPDQSWDFVDAALLGSSYYKLPRPLQWLTASVGLHHVHHIAPRVPNYHLQRCLDELPELRAVVPLTRAEQRQIVHLALWDEERQKLVRFRDIQARTEAPGAPP